MALFLNTEQLKKHVDIHKQTHWDTLKLFVEQSEDSYVIPLISPGIYTYLNSVVNTAGFDPETSFPEPEYKELYNRVCRVLAHFTMYEGLPFLNTPVGDIGVVQQQSKEGTATAAAQWRYDGRRMAHLNNADRFSDQLLTFMEANADMFLDWKLSPSYTVTKDLFINNGSLLGEYLNTQGSRRTFLAMRTYIRLSEKKFIIPAIGQGMFDELKTQLLNNSLTPANEKLMSKVREASAWSGYYEGFWHMQLRIDAEGIKVVTSTDGSTRKDPGLVTQMTEAYSSARGNMDTFLASLKQFIVENSADYPLFKSSDAANNGQPNFKIKTNRQCSGHFLV